MQTKTRTTHCAHSSVANVLFKVNRCYLSVKKICNCIPFKHEVMRNKVGLFTLCLIVQLKDRSLRKYKLRVLKKILRIVLEPTGDEEQE